MDESIPMPVIETARLRLRPIAADDQAMYVRLYTDPAMMRLIAHPLSSAKAQESFIRVVTGQVTRWRLWVMHDVSTAADIGVAALVMGEADAHGAEVGSMVLPPWQRRGYTVEALAALTWYGFTAMALPVLIGRHDSRNAGSVGVMRRLGFQPVQAATANDQWQWELTRAHWRQTWCADGRSPPTPGEAAAPSDPLRASAQR